MSAILIKNWYKSTLYYHVGKWFIQSIISQNSDQWWELLLVLCVVTNQGRGSGTRWPLLFDYPFYYYHHHHFFFFLIYTLYGFFPFNLVLSLLREINFRKDFTTLDIGGLDIFLLSTWFNFSNLVGSNCCTICNYYFMMKITSILFRVESWIEMNHYSWENTSYHFLLPEL